MEDIELGRYLLNPIQIQKALNLLDEQCLKLDFPSLFLSFEKNLGIQKGEGFPITAIWIGGMICRARLNSSDFKFATSIKQIGAKTDDILQGRANSANYPIFYGANNKKTAAFEVLQEKSPGNYIVTIGCWSSKEELHIANLVDGSDPDFKNLPFAHSLPKKYLEDWQELPRTSAILLIDYFRKKFKMPYTPGLYNITNVIAAIYFSLQNIDGIGYAAVSDKFEGFNIAIKELTKLECISVERWQVVKIDEYNYTHQLLETGDIEMDGNIIWQ